MTAPTITRSTSPFRCASRRPRPAAPPMLKQRLPQQPGRQLLVLKPGRPDGRIQRGMGGRRHGHHEQWQRHQGTGTPGHQPKPLTQAQCNALCLPPGATECK
ncbi:hypothetical protein LP419_36940 [Massilia sp. H-1]|nr:hypothetical protein LP419_36940 [Massilia sp. H-1]